MTDRYATNQFYNFKNYETSVSNPNAYQGNDNPPFVWPASSRKIAATGNAQPIQRGYMRMLTESYKDVKGIGALASRRLHFQFNPETLTRMVTARNDVQLWQNQDPFQFTQPIPGDANFSFDLIFNREAEIAGGEYRDASGALIASDTAAGINNVTRGSYRSSDKKPALSVTSAPYDQSWVTDIGVLADLMVFDEIIGQGMNQALISAIAKQATNTAAAYNKSIAIDLNGDGTADPTDKEIKTTAVEAEAFLSSNISNSAFLVAQPIRVVFSSSFMVEGFVSSTAVVFNKFNHAMVPTQCQISVQMQAMYIGFSQKETYLTSLLREYNPNENFQSSTTLNDKTNPENAGLVPLGADMFDKFQVQRGFSDVWEYVTPKRFIYGDGGTTNVALRFMASQTLKDFAKKYNGNAEITATAVLQMTYRGRTGGASAGGYAPGTVCYCQTATSTFKMSDLAKGADTLRFEFANKVPTGPAVDTDSTAKFTVNFDVYYHISTGGGGGGDYYALEIGRGQTTAPVTYGYNVALYLLMHPTKVTEAEVLKLKNITIVS